MDAVAVTSACSRACGSGAGVRLLNLSRVCFVVTTAWLVWMAHIACLLLWLGLGLVCEFCYELTVDHRKLCEQLEQMTERNTQLVGEKERLSYAERMATKALSALGSNANSGSYDDSDHARCILGKRLGTTQDLETSPQSIMSPLFVVGTAAKKASRWNSTQRAGSDRSVYPT